MRTLALVGVAAASVATAAAVYAQQALVVPPPTTAQIQATAAAVAQTVFVTSVPAPCTAVLPSDTLLGGLGTAAPCTPRADATRPTVVQAANTVTDGSGSWSVTWAKSFVSTTPIVVPVPVGVTALPMTCAVFTRTAASASGRCWQAVTTTLGGTLTSIAGAVISPVNPLAANTAVMVVGREPTQ